MHPGGRPPIRCCLSADVHNGTVLIEEATAMQSGQQAISMLCEVQAERPNTRAKAGYAQ